MSLGKSLLVSIVLCCVLSTSITVIATEQLIGLCYDYNGDNPPKSVDIVNTLVKYGISKLRIYEPNIALLNAIKASNNIGRWYVILGVKNQDIPALAASKKAAEEWVETNVLPYKYQIWFVCVGNEVVPSNFSEFLVSALQNVQAALTSLKLSDIKATTAVNTDVLTRTKIPSSTTFTNTSMRIMTAVLEQLSDAAPLLVNVYPYFVYVSDPTNIMLDYAQFKATKVVVRDHDVTYMNLFDDMLDGFYWAMKKIGFTDTNLIVSETGWPHKGNGTSATLDLAETYTQNLIKHIVSTSGPPKQPFKYNFEEVFLFSMVDENLKKGGVKGNFGLFKPNLELNYDIFT